MKKANETIARRVLEVSKAGQTEVIVQASAGALTRFANNTIHQNVAEENRSVTVRAVDGRRVGIASGNDLSPAGLKQLASAALEIARAQSEIPDFPGLPSAQAVTKVEAYFAGTAELSPAKRASAAMAIIKPSRRTGASASGTVSNEASHITVANSLGVLESAARTEYEVTTVIEKASGAGYAGGVAANREKVGAAAIGRRALQKCVRSAEPRDIEPGEYSVVLEPAAVAGLLSYMAYMGFGAQNYLDGRSFLCNRLGAKVVHESVSIWDDGLDPAGLPSPFDYEGQPRRRVSIIENGVAKNIVYDTYTAARSNAASTGHALPPNFTVGPLPTNLFMSAGTETLDDMISNTGHGLLVTRFHYINIADPMNAVLTGLTRDGTFLITRGRIRHPVKNLRFTESMLKAFSSVEGLSVERSLESAILGAAYVPAARISGFRFTGTTQF